MEHKVMERYQIIELIGKGGMSKIYKVKDTHLGKYWALKVIHIEEQTVGKNPIKKRILKSSILREMEILKDLEHPALPSVIDCFKTEHTIYIVIDYIEGENLNEKVKREGRQHENEILGWALQLCDVLEYLHNKNIIYRDLKPSNIMLKKDGRLMLVDFGTARIYKKSNTEDTVYLGTKNYAAPEQLSRRGQTDERTDIYSLGATLSYFLHGERENEREKEENTRKRFSSLEKVIRKCTRLHPDERYQSCKELKKDLMKCKKHKYHFNVKDANQTRERVQYKQKRIGIMVCMAVFVGISGTFCYMKKSMDINFAFSDLECMKSSNLISINQSEYMEISMKELSNTSKPSMTFQPIKTSQPTITSQPVKTIKPVRTSEPLRTTQPIMASNPPIISVQVQTDKPANTSAPTTIPKNDNEQEMIQEKSQSKENDILIEIIE